MMLYILTGDVQTGKSRWLERCVRKLAAEGVASYGVISAGIWLPSKTEHANVFDAQSQAGKAVLGGMSQMRRLSG